MSIVEVSWVFGVFELAVVPDNEIPSGSDQTSSRLAEMHTDAGGNNCCGNPLNRERGVKRHDVNKVERVMGRELL